VFARIARDELKASLRLLAHHAAKRQRIPRIDRAHILAVYQPPDNRRRDPANLYPSVKAVVDGIVDAGVLDDDSAAYLGGPDMRLGQLCHRGRLVLVITERPGAGGSLPRGTGAGNAHDTESGPR